MRYLELQSIKRANRDEGVDSEEAVEFFSLFRCKILKGLSVFELRRSLEDRL